MNIYLLASRNTIVFPEVPESLEGKEHICTLLLSSWQNKIIEMPKKFGSFQMHLNLKK